MNAPPSFNKEDDNKPHMPQNTFAPMIIDFLLDQNTTLASITQQSVVAVATELADTPKDSDRYRLNHDILNYEIFDGIVVQLIHIFKGKETKEDEEEEGITGKDSPTITPDTLVTNNSSIQLNGVKDTTNKAKKEELITNNDLSIEISSGTNVLLKNYDNGGVNLAKMSCLMLVSALAQAFGSNEFTEQVLPIIESLVADSMLYVRKEAAAAIGNVALVAPPSVVVKRLLPLYLTLSVDTIWHVRKSCVFTLPLLCEALPYEIKKKVAVDSVELFKNDASRNVRNSLSDIMGELISKFLPPDWKETGRSGDVPKPLLEFFISLGNTTVSNANQMFKVDTERIHSCAYNFPAVVLTAGRDYWDSHFKDTYLVLTKNYQLKVRRTFAYSLHEIARVIGPERTERDLVQIFALYLMDLDDVKQGVLEHLFDFLSVLDVSSRNEYIPILAEVWDGVMNNWHLRNILTSQLRDIAMLFDASRVVEHILPLAIRTCHDEYAGVRETGVDIFPTILDIVKRTVDEGGENLSFIGDENVEEEEDQFIQKQKYALALLSHVMEKLDELVRLPGYRTRLIPTDFASFFLPRIALLAKDPVVNVRIAVSKAMQTLCSIDGYKQDLEAIAYLDEVALEENSSPCQMLQDILHYLSTDEDSDVRFYISEFVSEKLVEDLQITSTRENDWVQTEATNKKQAEFVSSPPDLPAHLILPSAHSQEYSNNDPMMTDAEKTIESVALSPKEVFDALSEDYMDETASVESPMEIVEDNDINDTKEGHSVMLHSKMNDQEVSSFPQDSVSIEDHDYDGDLIMIGEYDATCSEKESTEVKEKAQHVFLSKITAHVVISSPQSTPAKMAVLSSNEA
ncbi:Serine/threonine-protein phosphatase 4 regulatory subunit 1 [Rhizopus stolonifer]|uniref:Serine/threonine-protein phosphatase 4 regulatory subunit 1 n=1 Tax=Rhizopus stolonifer TaxID=4846 RepID=A0A367JG73_RHIST|nr:Serine/threonine-protein phosphatase 4 regulatory subunit 1 [Rhizopus stolonifer]